MNENEMDIFGDDYELNFEGFETPDTGVEDENIEEQDENLVQENLSENEDSEEVAEEEDESSEGDSGDDTSPNLYSSLATVLYDEGLLPSLDLASKEIKSPAELAEAFKAEIEAQSNLRLEDYLKYVNLENIARSNTNLKSYSEIDDDKLDSDLELAKNLIYQDYINQGLSEERSSRLLNKLVDLGEDELKEEARTSLESLKAFESKQVETEKQEYQLRMKQQTEEQEKIQKQIKDSIYSSKELIEGLPLTNSIKDKVYKSMNDVVSKNPDTGELENKLMKSRREDPLNFDLKLYYLYELTNGFSSFKNIVNSTKSKAVKDLEKTLRDTKVKDTGLPAFLQDDQSYMGGFGSELNL